MLQLPAHLVAELMVLQEQDRRLALYADFGQHGLPRRRREGVVVRADGGRRRRWW